MMTSASPSLAAPAKRDAVGILLEWWPIAIGILLLYLPTFYDLWNGLWDTEEQAHGPIILALVLYLLWQKSDLFIQPLGEQKTNPILGAMLLLFGMAMYIIGRSQVVVIFEIGALLPLLAGIILITRGMSGVRMVWFALMFIIFMLPLPGAVVDAATGPLKKYISIIAENVLYAAGYPIGRTGVTIVIGQYQLLVADACSGLHSMFSLSALGVLYLYLMQYTNWMRNALIVAVILPIAFVANVVRVMILILVTYHFGDEAGQGFIHGSAGMLLFVISLILLFSFDTVLGKIGFFKDAAKPNVPSVQPQPVEAQ